MKYLSTLKKFLAKIFGTKVRFCTKAFYDKFIA